MKALIEFCRQHGTPKLKAAPDDRLEAYLEWARARGFLVVAGAEGRIAGLGIGWPCDLRAPTTPDFQGQTLYVANLACPTPAALREVLDTGARRWPRVRGFAGHRAELLVSYGLRHARLLYRLAAGEGERGSREAGELGSRGEREKGRMLCTTI